MDVGREQVRVRRCCLDQQQDLLRVPMEIGRLSQGKARSRLSSDTSRPNSRNMRIYYGKTGAWAEFKEEWPVVSEAPYPRIVMRD